MPSGEEKVRKWSFQLNQHTYILLKLLAETDCADWQNSLLFLILSHKDLAVKDIESFFFLQETNKV